METINILKDLISIPSWVDSNTNERNIGEWIFKFLKKNSKLKVLKQPIGNGRFNVIAKKGREVDILVTGHIDTVQPNLGWETLPNEAVLKDGKIYGRGASDMKCGVAVMLYLSTLPDLTENVEFLFYCDEEYDFLGMKNFVAEYKGKIAPKMIVSLDGGGLQIGNSCRGLIEIKVSVEGKAGHSANPKSGINAIAESIKTIDELKKMLTRFSSPELGPSTLNIAYINGGGPQGNVIAEKCEYIIEIRVGDERLNANLVKDNIVKNSENVGLKVDEIKIRHDLGSWITDAKELDKIVPFAPKKGLKSAKKSGYIDIQMLWEAFNKVPTFSLGSGESDQAHKANEYVKIANVIKQQKFYEKLLKRK